MKVYIVITPFFPTHDSFRGAFIYDQVCAISRTSRYGRIIIMRPWALWNMCSDYEYGGLKVHYFPIIQMPSNFLVGLSDKINRYLFIKKLKELSVDIRDISVVHAHVSLNVCYALALKAINPAIKTVLQHHDADPFAINMSKWLAECRWNTRINSRYFIKLYGCIDLHVSVSKKVEHNLLAFPNCGKEEIYPRYIHLLEHVRGLPSAVIKNTYILYNGVNRRIFYKTERAVKDKFVIGSIGNFQELKDQITLLRSLKRIVDAGNVAIEAILVGSGPELQRCKDYVAANGLERYVTFMSEMKHDDLRDFYNSIDLFVLPSYFEGFGCVFTEAYSCGVPFITCYNQGVSEIVEEPEKWLIEKGDDKRLAELITNYMLCRPHQHLNNAYDIDELIPPFLDYVERLEK